MSLASFEAVVLDVQLESREAGNSIWRIALDSTEFSVGDRGEFEARSRSGARLIVPVLQVVVDAAGVVWHVVAKPLTEGTKIIARRSV